MRRSSTSTTCAGRGARTGTLAPCIAWVIASCPRRIMRPGAVVVRRARARRSVVRRRKVPIRLRTAGAASIVALSIAVAGTGHDGMKTSEGNDFASMNAPALDDVPRERRTVTAREVDARGSKFPQRGLITQIIAQIISCLIARVPIHVPLCRMHGYVSNGVGWHGWRPRLELRSKAFMSIRSLW